MREEARQRVLLHRLDFAAQLGQRFAANLPQDLRIAPLAMKTAGTEAAFEHAPFMRKLPQRIFDHDRVQRKTIRSLAQRERPMGARVAANQLQHRLRHRLQQRRRQPRRQRNPQPIAVARRIFGGNQPPLAGNAQLQQAPRADQPVDMRQQIRRSHAPRQFLAATRSPRRKQRS